MMKSFDEQNHPNKTMLHHHNDGNILFNTTSKRKLDYYTIDKTSSTSVDNNLVNTNLQAGLFYLLNWKNPT